ncbi:MAG: gamma carbonic anhydrase family protein [Deltaproteobacteria bacterium]|nr:MAG: gamma carbonic anhydrase family protein [Deltaproteobacteria bacterium]
MLYRFDGKEPAVGSGAFVSETAQVIGDVVIGENSYIGHGAILRGDYGRIEIGPGTAVEEGVIIHAPPKETASIGKSVTIGHGAVIHSATVGDFAVIGMGAILSIRSEVGEWSIVGEGSVVKLRQQIPEGVVAVGNPAKAVRETSEQDKEFWLYGKELYVNLAAKYLAEGMEPVG